MISTDDIDALLPQTQCTKCGFAGCRPYADAIASGSATINRCPPGGAAGIERLAGLLECAIMPLDPEVGTEEPPAAVLVDETRCIGCTLCIQACPVDAIVGASKKMHTVLLDDCTGCGLCIPPCPVDCIVVVPIDRLRADGYRLGDRPSGQWRERAAAARSRTAARNARLVRERSDRDERLAAKAVHKLATLSPHDPEAERKRATIEAAMARARARRAATAGST